MLHKPLFETTDFETIKKVQRTIEQNKFFRITHKRQFNKILAAYRHYYLYIKNGLYHQPKSEVGNNEVIAAVSPTMPIHIEMADANSTVNRLTRTEQDERLLQKYPIIYKQVYATLKASDCALSIGILGEKISHIARPAVLEEILDNVSWGKSVGDEYAYSDEIVDHYIIINEVDALPTKEDKHRSATQPGGFTNAGVNNTTFYQYLSQKLGMAEATCRSYTSAINNCESFAKEHGLTSWRLYTDDRSVVEETIKLLMSNESFQEYNTKQHNRHRAALQKFLAFIGSENITFSTSSLSNIVEELTSYKNEEYEAVLRQYFTKGFRMGSPLEVRKFRRYYSAIHGKELPDSDDTITDNIKALSILYNGKAFLPDVMLNDEIKSKLFEYIDSAFADGKTAIYYQALYTEFAEAFLDHHIHDADMLKAYLAATGNGQFYIQRSFISKKPNVSMDPLSEIRDCLIEFGRPVEYEELFEALAHIPQNKIKSLLASNGEFVNNGQGAYFHEKIVHLSDEELEGIAEIISQTIAEKVFMGGNELYEAIKIKYSYIIEENKFLSVYGFRDALKVKLGDRFSFKGNIISHSGNELSMTDVFAKYAQTHDSFTLSELQGLASNLSTVIYFDAVYENSLRISKEQFVSKAMAQFAVSETDDALDRVCVGKYIPICEVQNFGVFPYAGFTWNSYLLEHYVASYSQKYKLLHSGFNGTECAGAIVRRSADINSFDDLIVDILVNNPIELNKSSVLQYLSDKGYLARRRYSEIESLIIKAKAQKQRKDD